MSKQSDKILKFESIINCHKSTIEAVTKWLGNESQPFYKSFKKEQEQALDHAVKSKSKATIELKRVLMEYYSQLN